MERLSGSGDNVAQRSSIAQYAAAVLSAAAALIHLFVMPEHFEEWWGYGAFFLVAALFQGCYAPALLRRPQPSLFLVGIIVNVGIVVLWLVTRTAGIPFFGPHAGEVESAGALDLAATGAELALVVVLAGLWWSTPQTGAARVARAPDESADGDRPSIWRGKQLLVLLGVSVAVAAGVALVMLLVTRPPGDGSPEAGFARDMMVHHAQAVEMAEIVRDRTEIGDIRILTTDIALTQQAQIGMMQGWLEEWGLPFSGTEPAMAWMGHPTEGRMPGMASPEEVDRLRELPPEEADKLFLRLMIEHHRAAIPMAKAGVEETDEPAVEELASAIPSSQRAEIETMQGMLKDMGAPPVEDEEPMPMEEEDHH